MTSAVNIRQDLALDTDGVFDARRYAAEVMPQIQGLPRALGWGRWPDRARDEGT